MKDGIVVECQCKDWQLHSEDVFRAQVFYAQHAAVEWLGGLWSFCPWCGTKLQRIEHNRAVAKPDLMTGITQWKDAQ